MSQIRVNIKSRVQNAAIKPDKRNGRDVLVIPSAVAKFDSVLNGIFYPKDELENSYTGINGTTAPLGHPMISNMYVPARSPEAINQFHIGAHNENARIEGDRILADMILDVEYAKRHPDGQRLLDAINDGKPVSTSTGLMMEREDAPEGSDYQFIGRNYNWDHVAVLLDEAPAIGTEAGIGLMVNSAGEQVEVVNSELEMDDDLLTMMAWEMVSEYDKAEKRQRNGSLVERIKNAVRAVMNGNKPEDEATGLTANQSTGDSEMTVTKEAFDALNAKVDALVANAEKQPSVAEQITEALKPVTEQLQANAEAEKAKVEAEKTTLVETVVEAKLATEEEAKALDVNALRIMARNCKAPKGADHPLNGGRLDATNSADESKYDTLPE